MDDLVIACICGGSWRELMQLDLGWCTSITDRGLLNLSQFHQQLLYLSLSNQSYTKMAVLRSLIAELGGFVLQ